MIPIFSLQLDQVHTFGLDGIQNVYANLDQLRVDRLDVPIAHSAFPLFPSSGLELYVVVW
jgi:hypothetical protein